MKEDSSAYLSEDLTSFIPVNKNHIFPYIEYNSEKQIYKVVYFNKEYFVPKKSVRAGSKSLCTIEPKCFFSWTPSQVFSEPTTNAKVIGVIERNSQVDWFGQTNVKRELPEKDAKPDKVRWFQVKVGEQYGWVEATTGKLEHNVCGGSLYDREKKWALGIQGGTEKNVPSVTYNSMLTTIENPENVTCLQNPLITNISTGSAQRSGGFFSYDILQWLQLRWGLFYEKINFVVTGKANPHPDPGQSSCVLNPRKLSELESMGDTITEENFVIPLGGFLKYNIYGRNYLLLGGNFNFISNVPLNYTFDYYTGNTLSKQTKNTLQLNPRQSRTTYDLEMRYLYKMSITSDYRLGLSLYYLIDSNRSETVGFTIHL